MTAIGVRHEVNAELNRRPEGTDRPEAEPEQRSRGLAEPGRHLTNAPVDRFRWRDVELDPDPPEWTKGVERLDDLPGGEELTRPDPDKARRADKLEQAFIEGYDDLDDAASAVARAVDKLFGPPPNVRPNTLADSDRGSMFSSPHYAEMDAGNAASALLAVGIVTTIFTHRVVDRLRGSNRE